MSGISAEAAITLQHASFASCPEDPPAPAIVVQLTSPPPPEGRTGNPATLPFPARVALTEFAPTSSSLLVGEPTQDDSVCRGTAPATTATGLIDTWIRRLTGAADPASVRDECWPSHDGAGDASIIRGLQSMFRSQVTETDENVVQHEGLEQHAYLRFCASALPALLQTLFAHGNDAVAYPQHVNPAGSCSLANSSSLSQKQVQRAILRARAGASVRGASSSLTEAALDTGAYSFSCSTRNVLGLNGSVRMYKSGHGRGLPAKHDESPDTLSASQAEIETSDDDDDDNSDLQSRDGSVCGLRLAPIDSGSTTSNTRAPTATTTPACGLVEIFGTVDFGDDEDGDGNHGEIPAPLPPAASVSMHASTTKTTMNATYVDDCEDGTAELNQYVLLEPLGKGTQGEVFLAMDTEKGELRAVKAVHRPSGGPDPIGRGTAVGRPLNAARRRQREQLEREVAIMKRCRHRNVVALYEVIDDPEQDRMYLVMQYVEHGPIASVGLDGGVSRTVTPDLLARYARQLADGLGYLHGRGVIHRDIKPENILLGSDEQVYLADFGTAEAFEGGATARVEGTRGTLAFVAPELLAVTQDEDTGALSISINAALSVSGEAPSLNRVANASWTCGDRNASSLLPCQPMQRKAVDGEAVDVWALGVTLYALLYGELPFFGGDASLLFSRILTADASFQSRSGHSSSSLSPGVSVAGGSHLSVPGAPATSPGQPPARRPSGSTAFHPSPTAEALVPGDAESAPRQEWRKLLRGMLRKDPAQRWTLADVQAGLERIEAAYTAEAAAEDAEVADRAISVLRRKTDVSALAKSRSMKLF